MKQREDICWDFHGYYSIYFILCFVYHMLFGHCKKSYITLKDEFSISDSISVQNEYLITHITWIFLCFYPLFIITTYNINFDALKNLITMLQLFCVWFLISITGACLLHHLPVACALRLLYILVSQWECFTYYRRAPCEFLRGERCG